MLTETRECRACGRAFTCQLGSRLVHCKVCRGHSGHRETGRPVLAVRRTCRCGKTVTVYGAKCPRECER